MREENIFHSSQGHVSCEAEYAGGAARTAGSNRSGTYARSWCVPMIAV